MAEKSRNLISFLCQYCGQPLKLHFSFSKLNQNTYNQLLGKIPNLLNNTESC